MVVQTKAAIEASRKKELIRTSVSKEKDALKNKTLTEGGLAELLGKIYFTNDILSIEVASMIEETHLKNYLLIFGSCLKLLLLPQKN